MGGIDATIWIMVGFMLAYFLFQRTATQVMNAISANQALFAYSRSAADTVLVRGMLEGFLMSIISAILLAGAALLGHSVVPADPLAVLEAFLGLWLIGMGFGLVTSVASTELVPELGRKRMRS